MDESAIKLLEDVCTKEVGILAEEIEVYGTCRGKFQTCLTDCPWPFSGAYLSSAD